MKFRNLIHNTVWDLLNIAQEIMDSRFNCSIGKGNYYDDDMYVSTLEQAYRLAKFYAEIRKRMPEEQLDSIVSDFEYMGQEE